MRAGCQAGVGRRFDDPRADAEIDQEAAIGLRRATVALGAPHPQSGRVDDADVERRPRLARRPAHLGQVAAPSLQRHRHDGRLAVGDLELDAQRHDAVAGDHRDVLAGDEGPHLGCRRQVDLNASLALRRADLRAEPRRIGDGAAVHLEASAAAARQHEGAEVGPLASLQIDRRQRSREAIAAKNLEFEKAALLRDQIVELRRIVEVDPIAAF